MELNPYLENYPSGTRLVQTNGALLIGDVVLGSHVRIDPNCIIVGPCTIGAGTRIYAGSIIGMPGESVPETDNESRIIIGEGVTLRENCVVQRSIKDDGTTFIGDGCYVMHGSHVAHDCVLDEGVVISPKVVLGGHTAIHQRATIGIAAMTHQRTTIGAWAMVGMGSVVNRDVPPAAKVVGNPVRMIGENDVGLTRHEVTPEMLARAHAFFDEYHTRGIVAPLTK